MKISIPAHRADRIRQLQNQIQTLAEGSAQVATYIAKSEELSTLCRHVVLDAGHKPDEFTGVNFTDSSEGMIAEAQERPMATNTAPQA